jgi:phage terminase large subunit-like protein
MREAWSPTLMTQPLSEDFITDGDKLLEVIDLAWQSPEDSEFTLDLWQRDLIRRVLERYPDNHPKYPGQLRYRQVVISMGRQNGKSVLGAVFALYALLLHTAGPEVVSVASTVPQANIIYDRVKYVIANNPALLKRFKTTGTRGIKAKDENKPATYYVKSGKEDSLQGVTISMCLFDEIHICKPQTWNAVVFGTSARRDGMVLGITTAGDSKSDLLKRLYVTGRAAATGEDDADERFGFFLWEAPEHLDVTDPAALVAANPSIACGRMDVDQEINAIRNMPEPQARRYRLNQFVSSESSWLPQSLWNALETAPLPHTNDVVFAVDRSENWSAATVTAAVRHQGKVYTTVVASVPNPSLDWLEEICADLWDRFGGMGFVMEAAVLKPLNDRLRDRGIKSEYFTQGQFANVSATVYSLISNGLVVHSADALLRSQVPKGVAKNLGEGWRISRKDSVGDVDALLATVMSIYAAEVMKADGPMLFVA